MRGVLLMYESITVVGERGQITIPKVIRELEKIRPGNKMIVKFENERIVLEKVLGKKYKEELMKEYYSRYAMDNRKLGEEMVEASSGAIE